MGINRSSGAGETSFSLLHQYARSKKYNALSFARSFARIALSFVALMLIPDKGWSQQGGLSGAHRLYLRAKENPVTPAFPATLAIEPTSPLGQALASCDKDTALQETFALPGLKGEVTLDRCYKGHDHLTCVFDALITEAKISHGLLYADRRREISGLQ